MFGAFAPLPLRLTGDSATHGWSAPQHARMCADMLAAWRTAPLAVMTVEVGASAVTLVSYHGRNGIGSEYAPTLTYTSATQPCKAVWAPTYEDDLGEQETWAVRHGDAEIQWSGSGAVGCSIRQAPQAINGIDLIVSAGIATPYRVAIEIYGEWGRSRNIGDYGGELEKRNNTLESPTPYAAQWYREMHAARGSAYTTAPYTLVDFENLAISRLMAASFSRNAEKLKANAVPAHADERLPYWVEVLGVPNAPSDPKWVLRQRCAAHYEAAVAPTVANVESALQKLLGDAFVALHTYEGSDLDTPPFPTYWPAGSHGPTSWSVGGAPWVSRRALLRVEVQQPPGMTLAEFLQLMDVQMFQLLDRMLPAWVTWTWSQGSDGFLVGGPDRIGVDGI
jgi:hypothetical protein